MAKVSEAVIKFGTDGWRAIMNDTFIIPNVRIVAQAIADYLKEVGKADKGIVIGYDMRYFAERFAAECASVMVANGIKVFMPARAIPTPVTAYAIKIYDAAGAIMLTASHNPPEYNGIKFIPDYAGPASPEITLKIENNIAKIIDGGNVLTESIDNNPLVIDIKPYQQYAEQLAKVIDIDVIRKEGLKVALDPMYGAGLGIMDKILAELGCNVETIHNSRDCLFGGSYPDPCENHLEELKSLMVKMNADIGLALDGDADRFGVVDYDGTYIKPNQVISLIAVHLLKNRGLKGAIVRTVATTHLLDEIAKEYGVDAVEVPVGFKYIAQEMMKRPVVVGGEESGGLSIQGHIPEKDGLLADLLLAEMMAFEKKPLTELLGEIYDKYGQFYSKRIDIHLTPETKDKFLENLKENPPENIEGDKLVNINDIDGTKMIFESGDWILARPSGTEPLVRVYIESRDEARFSNLECYIMENVE
jgi:alpha-D-glucose phosphate-specific phosphoglucomutase